MLVSMAAIAQRSPRANDRRAIERTCVKHIRDHLHCALDLSCKVNFTHVPYLVEVALLALDEEDKTRAGRCRNAPPSAA